MSLPPGPKTPAAIQMLEWTLRPIEFLERNHRRYGDFFRMRLAGIEAVMISDPAIIKDVFTGDPDVLHAGESNAAPLEPILGRNSVLLLDGPEHMRQRKLMLPSFQGDRMLGYGDVIAEATDREIDRFPIGRAFPLRSHTQAITLEVIIRAVFGLGDGQRLDTLSERLTHLLSFGQKPLRFVALALPGVRETVGRRIWSQFVRVRDQVDGALYDEIRERRNDPNLAERNDVMSILLQARDDDGKPMTDEELRDELMTLLVAGHETTATALAWAFDLLLHNPDKLERLRAELAQQPDGGDYLDAVIKETMRLRPVLPAVARKLTQPLELGGYVLPAGCRVAPNIYLTHRRADVYPDPEAFKPERFIEQPAETYSWIPFGGGIRRCLGASFALYEMKVAIPAILRRVELQPATSRPERIRRRAITFAPQHDTMVVATPLEHQTAAPSGTSAIAA